MKLNHKVPPVMITVANRIETSARIKYAFDQKRIHIPELCDTGKILQIDSKVLGQAEAEIETIEIDMAGGNDKEKNKLTKKQQAELLRRTVDTVGQENEPGEQIQNVISVGMLSEGWDAKTVTHIMGIRAFSSQLLCEQVVGRGLRRVSYDVGRDGLFEPEYVNIFGVPFTFLPHEGNGSLPPPPLPKTRIESVKEKRAHAISWPNVLRIDHVYKSRLGLDWDKVKTLEIDPYESITEAELAAIIAGKPNDKVKAAVGLEKIAEDTRVQTVVFTIASTIFNSERKPEWKGSEEIFVVQVARLVEEFLQSGKIIIKSDFLHQGEAKKKVLIILNMNKIIQHIWAEIRAENTEKLLPVFDRETPIRSTSDMRAWFTSRPCEQLEKSHISHCVYDGGWEATEARFLEKSELVASFAKNDHLGFVILYNYNGVIRKYYPDFLIRLTNGDYLVLEVKGQDSQREQTKREYLKEWVEAVNGQGGFGKWHCGVSFEPPDIERQLMRCTQTVGLPGN